MTHVSEAFSQVIRNVSQFELYVVHDNNLIQMERYWDFKSYDQTP